MANTPKVYVICDQNCKFESMTKEQILAAIEQAVNEGTIGDVDSGFIRTVKTINGIPLKFFVGTQAEYDVLTKEDKKNLFAVITNDATREGIEKAIQTLQTDIKELQEYMQGLGSGKHTVNKAENDALGRPINQTYGRFNGTWSGDAGEYPWFGWAGAGTFQVDLNVFGTYSFHTTFIIYWDGKTQSPQHIFVWGNENLQVFRYYTFVIAADGSTHLMYQHHDVKAGTMIGNRGVDAANVMIKYRKIL